MTPEKRKIIRFVSIPLHKGVGTVCIHLSPHFSYIVYFVYFSDILSKLFTFSADFGGFSLFKFEDILFLDLYCVCTFTYPILLIIYYLSIPDVVPQYSTVQVVSPFPFEG